MPSPFPGMNPYLERSTAWRDFHNSFIFCAREHLLPQVAPKYVAKMDEMMFIHEYDDEGRRLVGSGDVNIVRQHGSFRDASSSTAVAAPVRMRTDVALDYERHVYLELFDKELKKIVTVIELLSPSNKYAGQDRDSYIGKRNKILASSAHFVEIDLLRGGPRLPMEDVPPSDYCVLVSRAHERPEGDAWPIHLRQPLPTIPIPLRKGEREATLDLKAVIDRAYDAAGYDAYIYEDAPEPPLTPGDAAWAANILAGRTAAS